MTAAMIRQAEQIATNYFKEQVVSSYAIIGKGSVNQIAVVETDSMKAVIRMNGISTYEDYVKEQWCMNQAALIGVPGPKVLSVGKTEDCAYMIQTFVAGDNGVDSVQPKASIWRQIGEYAKQIHAIRTEGYGERLADPDRGLFLSPLHEGFDGSWRSFVQYNRDSLTEDDRLLELGVITVSESSKAELLFESFQSSALDFGLNHGDLSLKNTVVDPQGRVHLLDWGSAEVNLVPYRDFMEPLRYVENGQLDEPSFRAFLEGYGLNQREYAEMQHELNGYRLLIAFDKLRWAIDKKPDLISDYADYAHRIAKKVLK